MKLGAKFIKARQRRMAEEGRAGRSSGAPRLANREGEMSYSTWILRKQRCSTCIGSTLCTQHELEYGMVAKYRERLGFLS